MRPYLKKREWGRVEGRGTNTDWMEAYSSFQKNKRNRIDSKSSETIAVQTKL